MRKEAIYIIVALLLFGLGVFVGWCGHKSPQATISYVDTLRFEIRELKKDIAHLQDDRSQVQHDTIRIYTEHTNLVGRIENGNDSMQRAILRELTKKEDPTTRDVNLELAHGKQCCDLLDNSREQLRLCDTASALKDSVLALAELDTKNCTDALLKEGVENAALKADLNKKTNHLKGWRKTTGIVSAALIIESSIIYFLLK